MAIWFCNAFCIVQLPHFSRYRIMSRDMLLSSSCLLLLFLFICFLFPITFLTRYFSLLLISSARKFFPLLRTCFKCLTFGALCSFRLFLLFSCLRIRMNQESTTHTEAAVQASRRGQEKRARETS